MAVVIARRHLGQAESSFVDSSCRRHTGWLEAGGWGANGHMDTHGTFLGHEHIGIK